MNYLNIIMATYSADPYEMQYHLDSHCTMSMFLALTGLSLQPFLLIVLANYTCRIPVGWFSGSDVRTKSFFSPPSYGLILVLTLS